MSWGRTTFFLLLASGTTAHGSTTSILYLEATDWRQATPARKIELAADFMRVFCTDPRMSPESLAACLDAEGGAGPVFEQAIACASRIAGR